MEKTESLASWMLPNGLIVRLSRIHYTPHTTRHTTPHTTHHTTPHHHTTLPHNTTTSLPQHYHHTTTNTATSTFACRMHCPFDNPKASRENTPSQQHESTTTATTNSANTTNASMRPQEETAINSSLLFVIVLLLPRANLFLGLTKSSSSLSPLLFLLSSSSSLPPLFPLSFLFPLPLLSPFASSQNFGVRRVTKEDVYKLLETINVSYYTSRVGREREGGRGGRGEAMVK
jgi:hypothetical protein